MKISVAIATYNRLAMVRESIEAALEQTLLPGQIIVSDDASTDGTASMLEEWAARETRVRVLRQAANSGGVENWNIAMRAAAETRRLHGVVLGRRSLHAGALADHR